MHAINSIDEMPTLDRAIHVSQSLALLDAILMPEWEYRYFSFNASWDRSAGERMASMRDGEGDEFFLLFSPNGAVGKVLLSAEILGNVGAALALIPGCFGGFKSEPAFSIHQMTFCIWRQTGDKSWFAVPTRDDAYPWLRFLVYDPAYYRAWAEDYYEREINAHAVQRVYEDHEVTDAVIAMLNPEASTATLESDLTAILGTG